MDKFSYNNNNSKSFYCLYNPNGVISEALGHKGEKITQTYLKSFSNEVIDEANRFLLRVEQSSD